MTTQNMSINQEGLYDIYEAWHVPFWQTNFFLIVCIFVCFIIIFVLAFFALRWYQAKKAVLMPWDQALHDLELLKQHNIATAMHGKKFYSTLTVILKKYMHELIGKDEAGQGLALTDHEFIEDLRNRHIAHDLVEQLQAIFMGSLVIKFANEQAIDEQIDKDLISAIAFILQTKPSETKKTKNNI